MSAIHRLRMTQKLSYKMLGKIPYESDTEGILKRLVLCVRGVRQMCQVWLHDKLEEPIDVPSRE